MGKMFKLCAALAIILCASAAAFAENYVEMDRSGTNVIYIDTDSIVDEGSYIIANTKVDIRTKEARDKFKERSLTPLPGSQVAAPLVAECPLGLECRVTQAIDLGSHTLFLAEILAVQVSEELLDRSGRMQLEKAGLLAYAHGHYYELGRCLGHFGYSVRRKPGPTVRR